MHMHLSRARSGALLRSDHQVATLIARLPQQRASRTARATQQQRRRRSTAALATDDAASASLPATYDGSLSVFAVSDLHTDYAQNLEWVRALPAPPRGDGDATALIVAGDVSDDVRVLRCGDFWGAWFFSAVVV
jgi:hypothetical protein